MRATIAHVWPKAKAFFGTRTGKWVAGVLIVGTAYGAGVDSANTGNVPRWDGVYVYEDGGVRVDPKLQDQRAHQYDLFDCDLQTTAVC